MTHVITKGILTIGISLTRPLYYAITELNYAVFTFINIYTLKRFQIDALSPILNWFRSIP